MNKKWTEFEKHKWTKERGLPAPLNAATELLKASNCTGHSNLATVPVLEAWKRGNATGNVTTSIEDVTRTVHKTNSLR